MTRTSPPRHEIGIFSFYGYQQPIRDRLEKIAEAGFQATSFWYGDEEDSYNNGTMDRQVLFARSLGLEIDYVHAPFQGCNDIWVSDKSRRDQIRQRYLENIRFCADCQIPKVVIHISKGDNPIDPNSEGLALINGLVENGEKLGVMVAIENTRQQRLVEAVFSAISSAYLGLCYDSSHDRLWGKPIFTILESAGHRTRTVHLSDNRGERDDHLIPGIGTIDWKRLVSILVKIRYQGRVMLEIYPECPESETESEFLSNGKRIADQIAGELSGLLNPDQVIV